MGVASGYLLASALLPDVAASLRGLYGAEVAGQLSLSPWWWFSGLGLSLLGALLAGGNSLLRAARMPLLAVANPQAWHQAHARWLRRQAWVALGAAAMGLLAWAWGDSLASGFVLMAALLLAAALGLPVLLDGLLNLLARRRSSVLGQWFLADCRQQLPALSLALLALLLGLFAVLVTPREEEPQIDVTMANVIVPFPGAAVRDVEQMIATPAEQVLAQMLGVEHVMSVSRPGMAVLTVQFAVGVPRTEALVRLHDTLRSNADWLPRGLGAQEPIIRPKGIDDVPVVTLTLYSDDPDSGPFALERVAHSIEAELMHK